MSRETSDHVSVEPACPKACASCPWRLANQGSKPDPHGFYTKANLKRLWDGLRNGARMSCHPTDPRMAEFSGYEALADREVAHECAGSLVLTQREVMRFQDLAHANPDSDRVLAMYRKRHPNGMTREGLVAIVERHVFGGTPLGGVKMSKPDLGDPEVGYPPLDKIGG